MTNIEKTSGTGVILLGLLFILSALLIVGNNFWESALAAKNSNNVLEELGPIINKRTESGKIPLHILNPDIAMSTVEISGRNYIGVLSIPVLSLELPVLEDWNYPNLNVAPCCYEGTAYKENFVICAHNYGVHFGNIKYLSQGDNVIFIDSEGGEFQYRVTEVDILGAEDIDEMKKSGWDLTLFTCTVGGASRVTVRCEKV